MPSREGEGIHRHKFTCELSCGHSVIFTVRPRVADIIGCRHHEGESKILSVTVLKTLPYQVETTSMDNTARNTA